MQVRKSKTFNSCLVLDPRQLEQLLGALKLTDDQLTYSVSCLDGVTMRPGNLEDLIALPNPEPRAITRIEVSTRLGVNPPVQIDLRFGGEYGGGSAAYHLSGEDPKVDYTSRVIDDHLHPMMKRALLTSLMFERASALSLIPLILGAFGFGIAVYALIAYAEAVHSIPHVHLPAKSLWGLIGILASGLFLSVAGFKFDALITRLWPPAAFLIGAGRERHEKTSKIRGNILWSVVVALGVSLFAGILLWIFLRIFT